MFFRHTLSRKDAFLILLGASVMHVWSVLSRPSVLDQTVIVDTQYQKAPPLDLDSLLAPPSPSLRNPAAEDDDDLLLPPKIVTTTALVTETKTVLQPSPTSIEDTAETFEAEQTLPHTSIISHAPGWTLFRNLYMSGGTLFILSSNRSFPEIRLMTSTGLEAANTPENIASREPTDKNMDFITPEEAYRRWGADADFEGESRVWSVEGNTVLFNDPSQFLRHYYHFVAELFFGVWAFWHGAWSTPTNTVASSFKLSHPAPPPIHRVIFAHSKANGWRDDPGFNAYFLRAAFPSLTVEVQEDWEDRIAVTKDTKHKDRAWRFPVLLLTDRSAAHRGVVCGSQTQRTAAEAWEHMKQNGKLMGIQTGGWWEPVRAAVWRFAGARTNVDTSTLGGQQQVLDGSEVQRGEDEFKLPMPKKIVLTYISRQGVGRRKLVQEDHAELLVALRKLVAAKGKSWELVVLEAEKMTKDEQVQAAARTTILLGVHGNGLTHLVFMQPTRVSAVIELFYPGGFAHDYHWTSRALGMSHYAVWNDTHYTYPNEPDVDYPDGFQGNSIPVHGPAVAQLIEDHVNRLTS